MATIFDTQVTLIGRGNKTFTITDRIAATSKIEADAIMLQRFSNKRVLEVTSK